MSCQTMIAFGECDQRNTVRQELFCLDGLRKGVDYYLVVSSPSGTYRHFTGEVVRVASRLRHVPLLRFMRRVEWQTPAWPVSEN